MSVQDKVANVFKDVFAFDPAKFTSKLTPQDVKKWDSVGHMAMVAALETDFGIQFEVDEIMEMVNVEAVLKTLEKKGVVDGA
ncbi:MAG: acyl carrier protein [Candidatus Methylomirabilis sp.]|nr:acyl carrier protein [Deltaproteobacteria bacterium]